MIMALLAWFFLAGAASSGAILTSASVTQLRDRVAVVVEEPARYGVAKSVLAGLKKDVKGFEKAFTSSGKQLNRLYQDHSDNRQEALDVLAGLNSAWETGQARALDARFALRDALTEDEWATLFGDDQQGDNAY
jgi:hypothetical protein